MMKRDKVDISAGKRKSTQYAKKSTSFGIIAACLGVMAAVIGKGMQLDKKEAEEKAVEKTDCETKVEE